MIVVGLVTRLERNHALLQDDRDFDAFVALGLGVI
jgi:hypothetical protein